jgi:AcrR family transcriptional regulator
MNRRERQAADTRREILDTALRLFAERGYVRTSIADIAAEAGVAVPTVYTSVGAKPVILRHLLDRIDERSGVGPLAERLRAERDPATVLSIGVHITRQIAERSGDIVRALASAAGADAEIAEVYAAGLARHRAGAQAAIERIAQLRALHPPADEATAILATITSTIVYDTLTRDFGWSFDECERWLTETLAAQLLTPPTDRGGRRAPRD